MPVTVTREELQELVAGGAQVVEVLPEPEFAERHIAGALHIPLAELAARAPAELDPGRAVATYCNDFL